MERVKKVPVILKTTVEEPSTRFQKISRLFYPTITDGHLNKKKIRYIKYIGKLNCPQDSVSLSSNLKNVKRLWKLSTRPGPLRNDYIKRASKIVKALKPFSKYIKVSHRGSVPFISSAFAHIRDIEELELTQEHRLLWKKIPFRTKVKSLLLEIEDGPERSGLGLKHLFRLIRRIAMFKCLERFEINYQAENGGFIVYLIRYLNSLRSFCSSLKELNIDLGAVNVDHLIDILPYIVNLNIMYYEFSPTIISSLVKLTNLNITVYEGTESLSKLSLLAGLTHLKKLTVQPVIAQKSVLEDFFKEFCLPPNIETVSLKMDSVRIDNFLSKTSVKSLANFSEFIMRWSKITRLRHFGLLVQDETYGSKFLTELAVPILQQLQYLESLSIVNISGDGTDSYFQQPKRSKASPLELKSLWEGVGPLESFIKRIHIIAKIVSQEGFDLILSLFKKETLQITIEGLKGNNDKTFAPLLEQLFDVPKGRSLSVKVNMENVDSKILSKKLLDHLKRGTLKGAVHLRLEKWLKKPIPRFLEALNQIEKEASGSLKITMEGKSLILDIF